MPTFVYQQLIMLYLHDLRSTTELSEIKMQSFSKMCSHHIYSILLQKFVYLPKRKKYKLDSFSNLHHGYIHDQPLTLNLFLLNLFIDLQIIGFLMMHNVEKETIAFIQVSCFFIYFLGADLNNQHYSDCFYLLYGSDVLEAELKIGSGWFTQTDLAFGNLFIRDLVCWNIIIWCDNGAAMQSVRQDLKSQQLVPVQVLIREFHREHDCVILSIMLCDFKCFHILFANPLCHITCHLCLR